MRTLTKLKTRFQTAPFQNPQYTGTTKKRKKSYRLYCIILSLLYIWIVYGTVSPLPVVIFSFTLPTGIKSSCCVHSPRNASSPRSTMLQTSTCTHTYTVYSIASLIFVIFFFSCFVPLFLVWNGIRYTISRMRIRIEKQHWSKISRCAMRNKAKRNET